MVEPHPVSLDGKGRAHAWHSTRGKTNQSDKLKTVGRRAGRKEPHPTHHYYSVTTFSSDVIGVRQVLGC